MKRRGFLGSLLAAITAPLTAKPFIKVLQVASPIPSEPKSLSIDEFTERYMGPARGRFSTDSSTDLILEADDFNAFLKYLDDAMRRERASRPCLTFDRVTPAVKQMISGVRTPPRFRK